MNNVKQNKAVHPFPDKLNGAKVLYYTDRGDFDPVCYIGGAIAHRVVRLAVCKYDNDEDFYIFHLDENLKVVADDCFSDLETCKRIMNRYNTRWHEYKN